MSVSKMQKEKMDDPCFRKCIYISHAAKIFNVKTLTLISLANTQFF